MDRCSGDGTLFGILDVDALLELLLCLTQGTGQLGQLGASEKQETDHEDDEELSPADWRGEQHAAKCSGYLADHRFAVRAAA